MTAGATAGPAAGAAAAPAAATAADSSAGAPPVVFDALTTSMIDRAYAEKLRSLGIQATHYTVADTSLVHGEVLQDDFAMACRKIGRWYRMLDHLRDVAALATSVAEMDAVVASGRLAVWFGFQNGSPIEDDLDHLTLFHRLGVRFVQLTYNARNLLGSGSGERRDDGLSDLGLAAVARMNELGIAVDLSHCHARTTMDAIEASRAPVLFTHANVRALADTPRNKCDDAIVALARKGGVMGIKHMLGDTVAKPAEATTVEDVADHVAHVARLVGIEHVGIGSDFSGTTERSASASEAIDAIRRRWPSAYLGRRAKPRGFDTIDGWPNLTRALRGRGFGPEELALVYGGNWRRVIREIVGG